MRWKPSDSAWRILLTLSWPVAAPSPAKRKTGAAKSKTSKADLVAAIKESFDACDKAFDALTDANALEPVAAGRGQQPRIAVLYGLIVHSNEVYGAMGVYMRLKGIVPPSSEGR